MIALAVALLGCGEPPPPPDLSGPPLDGAPCAPDDGPPLDRDVTLRLVRGRDVDEAEVVRLARAMAAYWEPRGVRLHVDGPVAAVPLDAALGDGDVDESLAPLRGLGARSRADVVLVVVLPRVAPPLSTAEQALGDVGGLTVPPAGELHDRVGAPGPIVVLAAGQRARPGAPLLGPAHELGHALGLPHAGVAGDLMSVHPPECVPPLTADERALLAR